MPEHINEDQWNGINIKEKTSASGVLTEITSDINITTAFPKLNTAYTHVNAALNKKKSLEVPQSSLLALEAGEVAYKTAINTVEVDGIEQLAINFTDAPTPTEKPYKGAQIHKEVWTYPVVNLNNLTALPTDSLYKDGGSSHTTNPFAAPANLDMIQDRIDDMISKNEWGFGAKVSVNHSKFYIDKLGDNQDTDNYTEVFLKLIQGTETKSIFSMLPGVVKMYNTMLDQVIGVIYYQNNISLSHRQNLTILLTGFKFYNNGVEVSTIEHAKEWAPVGSDEDRKRVIAKLITHFDRVKEDLTKTMLELYDVNDTVINLLNVPIGIHPLNMLGTYIMGLSVDELTDKTFGEDEEMLVYKINSELETLYHSNEYLTYADVIKTVNTINTKLPVHMTNLNVTKAVALDITCDKLTADTATVEGLLTCNDTAIVEGELVCRNYANIKSLKVGNGNLISDSHITVVTSELDDNYVQAHTIFSNNLILHNGEENEFDVEDKIREVALKLDVFDTIINTKNKEC
jgi:hypothetical protein